MGIIRERPFLPGGVILELDFRKNLGNTDRVIRIGIGLLILILVALRVIAGWLAVVAVLFAISQFIEGLAGY